MKLVAEQVKYLRERRKKLLESIESYIENCASRENVGLDDNSGICFSDFQSDVAHQKVLRELDEINDILRHAEIVTERNFDFIDIGTRFSVRIDGSSNTRDDLMLIEAGSPIVDRGYTNSDSDFGRAVLGKGINDSITYKVTATGRVVSLTIVDIDTIEDNYEHFIRETEYANRFSRSERKILRNLSENNPELYEERHYITESQKRLVSEEYGKLDLRSKNLSDTRRKTFLESMMDIPVAKLPEDGSIGIGSIVTVLLIDDNGDMVEKSFELVNRAVSTELDSHYVERISPLGHAIYGLSIGDKFKVRRKYKPSLVGEVISVENSKSLGVQSMK